MVSLLANGKEIRSFKTPCIPLSSVSAPTNVYRVENLHPKTYYFVRARAENLAGHGDASNIIFMQTSSPHVVSGLLANSSAVISVDLTVTSNSSIVIALTSIAAWILSSNLT